MKKYFLSKYTVGDVVVFTMLYRNISSIHPTTFKEHQKER